MTLKISNETNDSTVNLRLLPFGTQEFIHLLGEALAFKIMLEKGGRFVNVPPAYVAGKTSAALRFLDEDERQVLIRCYASERVLVPKFDRIATQYRDARMCQLRRDGWTIPQLAEHYKLTVRRVYKVLGNDERSDAISEPDLFGEQVRHVPKKSFVYKPVKLGLDELGEIIHGLNSQINMHDHYVEYESDERMKAVHREYRAKAERALDKVMRAKQQILDKTP